MRPRRSLAALALYGCGIADPSRDLANYFRKFLDSGKITVTEESRGMFPSSRSLAEAAEEGEAEERRLFYVAVTRAKDELLFCVPELRRMGDGGIMTCTPSRFIVEIPTQLLRQAYPSCY